MAMAFNLTSRAFAEGGEIPKRFTCEGEDVSPDLAWADLPAGTRSLVLIVDDPDAPDPAAPKMVFDHWLLYNVPADAGALPAASEPTKDQLLLAMDGHILAHTELVGTYAKEGD